VKLVHTTNYDCTCGSNVVVGAYTYPTQCSMQYTLKVYVSQ